MAVIIDYDMTFKKKKKDPTFLLTIQIEMNSKQKISNDERKKNKHIT